MKNLTQIVKNIAGESKDRIWSFKNAVKTAVLTGVLTYAPLIGFGGFGCDGGSSKKKDNNIAPVLQPISPITANENDLVKIVGLSASDVDKNYPITFLYQTPLNSSGEWQTNYADAGIHNLTVTPVDAKGKHGLPQTVQITINNVNDAPQITGVTPSSPVKMYEGETQNITPTATDPFPPADTMSWDFEGSTPSWLSIDPATGKVTATPTYSDAGNYTFTVVAKDSFNSTDTADITLNVVDNFIAFVSDQYGSKDIFTMDPDGNNRNRVTNFTYEESNPTISPDKQWIAFDSNNDFAGATDHYEIYKIKKDGTGLTRLTSDGEFHREPAWSPLTNRILDYTVIGGLPDMWIMNATSGSNRYNLTNNGLAALEWSANWFPDESKIALRRSPSGVRQIYIMNADATIPTNISNTISLPSYETKPCVSPDGLKIINNSDRDGHSQIYIMDSLTGTGQTNLSNNAYSEANATWSPNGQFIYFESNRNGPVQIYQMNADGTNQTRISNNAYNDTLPACND